MCLFIQEPTTATLKQNIYAFIDNYNAFKEIPSWARFGLKRVVGFLPENVIRLSEGLFGAKFPSTGIEEVLQSALGKTLYAQTQVLRRNASKAASLQDCQEHDFLSIDQNERNELAQICGAFSVTLCHEEHHVQLSKPLFCCSILIRLQTCSKLSETTSSSSLVIVAFDVLRNRPIVFYYDEKAKGDERTGFATIRRSLEKSEVSSVGSPIPPGCW